jgi:hypothetical protein
VYYPFMRFSSVYYKRSVSCDYVCALIFSLPPGSVKLEPVFKCLFALQLIGTGLRIKCISLRTIASPSDKVFNTTEWEP